MLLAKLRNRKVHLYSTFIIVFAILAKMLMPIAHASNTISSNQKGFLASLCSGNKIVFIELNLSSENKPEPNVAVVNNKCSLCNLVEQTPLSNNIAPLTFSFQETSNKFTAVGGRSFNNHSTTFSAIRAPPTLS